MKGIVFNLLGELVEEKFGLEVWESLLESSDLTSRGIYTAAEFYDDEEIFTLVAALSEKTEIEANTLVKVFGEFLFERLSALYPMFVENYTCIREFLKTIDGVIHVEVRKLHPDAALPTIEYEETEDSLTLLYHSPRQLCYLAEGLISGAAKHFKTAVIITHPVCMHEGAERCHLVLTFPEA